MGGNFERVQYTVIVQGKCMSMKGSTSYDMNERIQSKSGASLHRDEK